jgi:hypothetical protein
MDSRINIMATLRSILETKTGVPAELDWRAIYRRRKNLDLQLQALQWAPTSVAECVGDHQAQAQLPLRYGVLVDQEPKCAAVDLDCLAIQELILQEQSTSQWAVVSEATWDYPAVTQTIYVTEADQKAQVFAGRVMAPQDVCVQKVVREATVIVLPLHQPIAALEQTDFATPKPLVKTAE